jgi:hypothetical protein
MQRYTVYFIWKLPYMFRVVPPPIIRSANNCIYSISYLSQRYCYLPLSWKSWNWFECAVGGVLTFKNHASYIYRTGVPLPSRRCILYIFSTNISTDYFKHAANSPFFSSKCRLFDNAIFFGSCIIHILHTGCAKI